MKAIPHRYDRRGIFAPWLAAHREEIGHRFEMQLTGHDRMYIITAECAILYKIGSGGIIFLRFAVFGFVFVMQPIPAAFCCRNERMHG